MADRGWLGAAFLLVVSFAWPLSAQERVPWHDPSPHTIQFVTVDDNVKLEVLDWGGSGRPVVLLAGLGNTAHVFDEFAPKLTSEYRVYGITRRGFGASSAPVSGYSADRLGDDVLAVLGSLKIDRAVLVGHSIAGEELSSVGSRHPERVAGLIYLDAGYSYAYYDPSLGNVDVDSHELQEKLEQLRAANTPQDEKQLVQELLQMSLPAFERDLKEQQLEIQASPPTPPSPTAADQESFGALNSWRKRVYGVGWPEAESRQQREVTAEGHVGGPRTKPTIRQAITTGQQKYTDIRVPILAIFAIPQDLGSFVNDNPAARTAYEPVEMAWSEARVKAFEAGVPSSRVVRLAHANHYLFLSNEADVLREMHAFLTGLY
jgi:non-heme chloroperoxidase